MARHRWTAHRIDTDEQVSHPYYVGAPAMRVAQREADRLGVAVQVKRDGRPYDRPVEPAGGRA
jgi:hypothetical protein